MATTVNLTAERAWQESSPSPKEGLTRTLRERLDYKKKAKSDKKTMQQC